MDFASNDENIQPLNHFIISETDCIWRNMALLFLVMCKTTEHFTIGSLCFDKLWKTALSPVSMGNQVRGEGLVTCSLFPCFTGETSDFWSWGGVTVILEWSLGRGLSCLSADKGHTRLAAASAMGPGPHPLPSSLGVTPQLFSSLLVTLTLQHLLPLPYPSPPSSIRRWYSTQHIPWLVESGDTCGPAL